MSKCLVSSQDTNTITELQAQQQQQQQQQQQFFQKNYFLQWNATAAGSSQSNISRLYILKKHSYQQ